jgi:hypothetical protein
VLGGQKLAVLGVEQEHEAWWEREQEKTQ